LVGVINGFSLLSETEEEEPEEEEGVPNERDDGEKEGLGEKEANWCSSELMWDRNAFFSVRS
jgi:hypothetical protein